MTHMCDEIRVYDSIAERTGVTVDAGGMKGDTRICSTLRDLVRKHRSRGDGHFYLRVGNWPETETTVALNDVRSRKK